MTRRTDKDVQRFYAQKGGAKMLTDPCRSPGVSEYLAVERDVLEQVVRRGGYRTLVEVGCGQGRYLPWAMNLHLQYQGLDLVPWLVDRGRKSLAARIYAQNCRLDNISVKNLDRLIHGADGWLDPAESIVFFPFNCFGNLAQPEETLDVLAEFGFSVFASNFNTALLTTLVRSQYYASCGYTAVEEAVDERGVLIRSAEGLNSYAYRPGFMNGLFRRYGYDRAERFGIAEAGTGYYFARRARVRSTKGGKHAVKVA